MVALATYMGHVNIYATYWYLEAAADLMRDVAAAGEEFLCGGRAVMTPIAPLIEAFLRGTLSRQRGASRHTQDSYALSFQLLFVFAAGRLKIAPSALTLEQIDARLVAAFLEHLEDVRKNAAVTRNVRLAAIKSFFRFLEYRQPAALEQIRRVLDPVQEDGCAPGSLSAARGVASRARRS